MVEKIKTGTTTVALVCKDGIVLAADMRATAGSRIAQRDCLKITKITKNIAVTHAGVASDIQLVEKLVTAELKLMELRNHRSASVSEAAHYVSGVLYNVLRNPYAPSIVHFLMAGYDSTGPHIYDLSPDGVVQEVVDFDVSGSGGDFAVGIIDAKYQKGVSVKDAMVIAVEAVQNAIKRDSGSGDGVHVVVIDKDGVHEPIQRKLIPRLE